MEQLGEIEQVESCELEELSSLLSDVQLSELKTRRYQQEIIEKVLQHNCIVFLATGTGKTFIAAEAIKRLKSQILGPWTRQADNGEERIRTHFKRTFFVCNMVPLAIQQEEYLANHLGIKFHVKRVIGADVNNNWDKEHWFQEFESSEVFVVTGEILRNLLSRAVIQVRDINLLIFDEAHHATKDDIYKQIMDKYHIERREGGVETKILGLTASLLNEKNMFSNLSEKLQTLTTTYNSRIVTTRDFVEVEKHCARPEFSTLCYSEHNLDLKHKRLYQHLEEFISFLQEPPGNSWKKCKEEGTQIKTIYKEFNLAQAYSQAFEIKDLSCIKKIANKLITVTGQLGPWGSYKFARDIFRKLTNEELYVHIEHDYVKAAVTNLRSIIFQYISEWDGMQPEKQDVSCKVQVLCDQLRLSSEQKDFCGIAFVKDKVIAYMLNQYLGELSLDESHFKNIKASYFTGQSSSRKFPHIALTCRDQIERLKEFRNGKFNFLFATDVLLEGFNVPQCNLVITFDGIDHYRYFTQSRGRARAKGGRFISLVSTKNEEKVSQELWKYDKAEIELRTFILDNYFFSDEDISEPDNIPKPLISKSGASITYEQSVSYIYQYCQLLIDSDSIDQFTVWTPVVRMYQRKENKANRYYCIISMPKSCYALVEDVESEVWVKSIKMAQRYAALNVCKKLYGLGEIDDSLKPRYRMLKQIKNTLFQEEGEMDYVKDSHKKRRKTYPIKISDTILRLDITNTTGQYFSKYFIYPILITLKETASHSLAILSSIQLETLPPELDFIDPKEIKRFYAKIKGPYQLNISNDTIEQLIRFHEIILKTLLSMPRYDFQFMSANSGIKKYIIIPIKEEISSFNIDNKRLVQVLKTDSKVEQKHLNADLEPKAYIGKIVRKHYDPKFRNTYYKIVEAGRSVSINSAFLDPEVAPTYKLYFKEKYGIELINPDQPYLTVESFSFSIQNYTLKLKKILDIQEVTSLREKTRITLFPELVEELPLYENISFDLIILPSLLHLFESYLSVLEFRDRLYPNIDSHFLKVDLLYSALTLRRCQEEKDLERLEFLGDTCLKMMTSLSLYCSNPTANQALLTLVKSICVSNKMLFDVATDEFMNLPYYIRGREFVPKTNWLPPRLIPVLEMNESAEIPPKIRSSQVEVSEDNIMGTDEEANEQPVILTSDDLTLQQTFYLRQYLASKSIADSFEAIIGAIITSGGLPSAMNFLNTYGGSRLFTSLERVPLNLNTPLEHILNPAHYTEDPFQMFLQNSQWFRKIFNYNSSQRSWDSNQAKLYEMNHQKDINSLASKMKLPEPLKEEHVRLLLEAITHDSYNLGNISLTRSYQRLEFLGDALLDYLVTAYLICHTPNTYQPKDLHILRSCVVSNRNYARLTIENGLYQDLLYTSQRMEKNIREFVSYIHNFQTQRNTPKELKFYQKELTYLLQQKNNLKNNLNEHINETHNDNIVEAPKALGDAFESLACAIFLISDFSLQAVWNVLGDQLTESIKHFKQVYDSNS